jgi:flagellar biosynthesis protein FlhF
MAGDSSPLPVPGSTYRLVVSSAEEAVRLIHEKLGPHARVVSVKQIGGRGFGGLLRAPQLEVIAEIPAAAAPAPPAPRSAGPSITQVVTPAAPPITPIAPVAPSITPGAFSTKFPRLAPTPAPPPPPEDESTWLQQEPVAPPPPAARGPEPLERLLTRGGLSDQVLDRLRLSPQWDLLRQRPLGEALKEVVEMLRAQWHETPERPLGARVAFFGPPGSGSTTALCKALTIDVFFQQQPAVVMKLDGDQPNPTEGLAMFCEALKVPLIRSADDLEHIPDNHRFYFDATGSPLQDGAAWRDLGRLLGEFYIESRVLVLNAAYDVGLLKRAYTLGHDAGATHVVFTHMDEVHHWGKLWDLLLSGGLQPLFFSCGQNVCGELREDTFDLMAQRILGGQG